MSQSLASIDYIIIAVYMLGVLFVGSYFSRYVHSAGDLFLGGRSLPFSKNSRWWSTISRATAGLK